MIEHDPCAWCAVPIERREGETVSKFLRRATCSARCAGRLAQRRRSVKKHGPRPEHDPCPQCGRAVRTRPNQSVADWLNTKFCSIYCRDQANGGAASWPRITDPDQHHLPPDAFAVKVRTGASRGRLPLPPATYVATERAT